MFEILHGFGAHGASLQALQLPADYKIVTLKEKVDSSSIN